MQRKGSSVGPIVEQPLDSLLVSIPTFILKVWTACQDVVDLLMKTETKGSGLIKHNLLSWKVSYLNNSVGKMLLLHF